MNRDNGRINGTATTLNRNIRSMPQWVNEQNQMVGPKPPAPPINIDASNGKPPSLPPKKMQPDPDYEVIEFSGQQYSNSDAIKTSSKRADGMKCDLCGSLSPKVKCEKCNNQLFCGSCDDMFHRHPKRKNHIRKALDVPLHVRPPLPPKGESISQGIPVPPPRRNKKSILPSPFLGRKDQHAAEKLEPPSSPTLSIRDRLGSVRKALSTVTIPLPDGSTATLKPSLPPPRPITPVRESAFDTIQKPPSLAMERIKNQTTATLDRMSILQQRYRQHQELMRSSSDYRRDQANAVSQNDNDSSSIGTKYRYPDFASSSKQWNNTTLNRLRSGSMATGMNTMMHGHISNCQFPVQELNPMRPGTRLPNISNSVFDLNHAGQRHQGYPPVNHTPFNQNLTPNTCLNCSQQQLNWNPGMQNTGWDAHVRNLNGSNMSLNLPPPGYYPPPHNWGPPPTMYPYPVGMFPVLSQGLLPATSRSRAPSRSNSRAPSPSLSIKSRKSIISARNAVAHSHYLENELTDDEESDSEGYLEDIRSTRGRRQPSSVRSTSSRNRITTTQQIADLADNTEVLLRNNNNRSSGPRSNRERRGSSQTKTTPTSWVTQTMEPIERERLNRHDRRKIISEHSALTPDSESESAGTKALVQAKIREKLAQQSSVDESSSDFWKGPRKNAIDHNNKIKNIPAKSPTLMSDTSKTNQSLQTKSVSPLPPIPDAMDVDTELINDDSLGSPPSTPNEEWECQFCTFVNEPNIKICVICCKTQIKFSKEDISTASNKNDQSPFIDHGPVEPETDNSNNLYTNSLEPIVTPSIKSEAPEISKISIKRQTRTSEENVKQKSSSSSDGTSKESSNGKNKDQTTAIIDVTSNSLERKSNQKHSAKNFEDNIHHYFNISGRKTNENNTSPINEFKNTNQKKQHSTGCGPSPPKDIANSGYKITATATTGTSPSPQSTSTQTYDTIIVHRDDNERVSFHKNNENGRSSSTNTGVQTFNDNSSHASRSLSRHSFSNDSTQSGPLTPSRDMSPTTGAFINKKNYINDEILTYIDQSMNEFNKQSGLHRMPSNQSLNNHQFQNDPSSMHFNEWYNDMPKYIQNGNSQVSRTTYRKATQPQDKQQRANNLQTISSQVPAMELAKLLREGERYKYTTEELHAALSLCGNTHPIDWLRENWSKLIETVQTLATKYGQERKENIVGTISLGEARDALRMHKGNVWHAVTECIEQRQNKFNSIMSRGNYSREDIVTALTAHQGNLEMALVALGKTQLKPFLMRIWGPPVGEDNESGNLSATWNQYNESNDLNNFEKIQNYLSGNIGNKNSALFDLNPSDNRTISPVSSSHSIRSIEQKENEPSLVIESNDSSMLKDIEILIGNMEQNQAKQNENVLKSIEQLLSNILVTKQLSRSPSSASNYSLPGSERILVKSPIPHTIFSREQINSSAQPMEENVKQFMSDHIQDVVPDLVGLVEKNLTDNSDYSLLRSDITNMILFDQNQLENENDLFENGNSSDIILGREEEIQPKLNDVHFKQSDTSVQIANGIDDKITMITDGVLYAIIPSKSPEARLSPIKLNTNASLLQNEDNPNILDSFLKNELSKTNKPEMNKTTEELEAVDVSNITNLRTISDKELPNEEKNYISNFQEKLNFNTNTIITPIVDSQKMMTQSLNIEYITESMIVQSTELIPPDPLYIASVETSLRKIPSPKTPLNIEKDKMSTNEDKLVPVKEQIVRNSATSATMVDEEQIALPKVTIDENNTLIKTQIYEEKLTSVKSVINIPSIQASNYGEKLASIEALIDEEKPLVDTPINERELVTSLQNVNYDAKNSGSSNFAFNTEIKGNMIKADLNLLQSVMNINFIEGEKSKEYSTTELSRNSENNKYFEVLDKNMEEMYHAKKTDIMDEQTPIESNKIDSSSLSVLNINGSIALNDAGIERNSKEISVSENISDQTEIITNVLKENLDNLTSSTYVSYNDTKMDKNPQNLSELVKNTQKLIQQMKDEINSDIASYLTDEEYQEYVSEDWSEEAEEEEQTEGELNEGDEEEDEEEEAVDWTEEYEDIEESEYFDEEEEEENLEIDETKISTAQDIRSSTSMTSNRSLESISINNEIKVSVDIDETKQDKNEATTSSDKKQRSINVKSITSPEKSQQISNIIFTNTTAMVQAHDRRSISPNSKDLSELKANPKDLQLNITKIQTSLHRNPTIFIERSGTPDNRKDITPTPDEVASNSQVVINNELNLSSKSIFKKSSDYLSSNNLLTNFSTAPNTSENIGPEVVDNKNAIGTNSIEKNFQKDTSLDGKSLRENDVKIVASSNEDITNRGHSQNKDKRKKKLSNKIPVRKASLPGLFGQIGTTNVKTLQAEFLNKTSSNGLSTFAKPSKLVQPKVYSKDVITSLTERITKFIKPYSNNQVEQKPEKNVEIPKKKYHETCFSDEYQSSDEEENQKMKAIQKKLPVRQQSMPNIMTNKLIADADTPERKARILFTNGKVKNMVEAHLAVALMNLNFDEKSAMWAASECCSIEQAISALQQECEICVNTYPANEIVAMLKCTHRCCNDCAKSYFTTQVSDRNILDCICPFCKMPELTSSDITDEQISDYFVDLDHLLKSILDENIYELFQRKLRDRTLMKDPNFKWCVECSSGFFARPKQKRLICPDCGSVTCALCRKQWEKQHQNISCEKFTKWKEENDPETQAIGVAEHLKNNGIDCPKCKFRYSLSRGGCMHFTCIQCKYEFCYGCGKAFKMGAKCGVSEHCARLGLHSHHPRNCLFYLRDKDPKDLEKLLDLKNISYRKNSSLFDSENDGAKAILKCPIPIQKDSPNGLIDTICKNDILENHGGLCREHYVEYLVNLVSKAKIDSLPILDLTDCVQELRRRGIPLPERGPWDTDEIYREMCQKIILDQIPLE